MKLTEEPFAPRSTLPKEAHACPQLQRQWGASLGIQLWCSPARVDIQRSSSAISSGVSQPFPAHGFLANAWLASRPRDLIQPPRLASKLPIHQDFSLRQIIVDFSCRSNRLSSSLTRIFHRIRHRRSLARTGDKRFEHSCNAIACRVPCNFSCEMPATQQSPVIQTNLRRRAVRVVCTQWPL